jgi:hypothetical protein
MERVSKSQRQRLAVDLCALQRRALKKTRWAYLNASGAADFGDAAELLHEAADICDMLAADLTHEAKESWREQAQATGAA